MIERTPPARPGSVRWRGAGLALAILWCATASAAGPSDPCPPGERTVFACTVAHGKVVAVCRSPGPLRADGSLQYRFGRPGQPELVFPSSPAGSVRQFRYAHYFRSQVDRAALSFAIGGAHYTVYDDYEGDQKPAASRGVRVEGIAHDVDLRCVGPVVSRLVELEPVVPCDPDGALATCQ